MAFYFKVCCFCLLYLLNTLTLINNTQLDLISIFFFAIVVSFVFNVFTLISCKRVELFIYFSKLIIFLFIRSSLNAKLK